MTTHQGPMEREQSGLAETFLSYVSTAGIAITALLVVGAVVGLLVLYLPTNEAIATVVFTGLLAVVFAATRYFAPTKYA